MASLRRVTLPDGSMREVSEGTTGLQLAEGIGRRLAAAAVAIEVDGELRDLTAELPEGAKVRIVTADSDEGRAVLRHSTAHVMAQAVTSLWPGTLFAIGPATAEGFYYDFELPGGAHFSEADLSAIDARMRQIVAEGQPFVRQEVSFDEGLSIFAEQPYKREIIEGVRAAEAAGAGSPDSELSGEVDAASGSVSLYRNSPVFVDLCRGPHVPSTDRLGYFRLTRLAGAYWRGDERRQQLQRIYGTAFESEAALEEHLERVEEAERRDHRKLGSELDLFSFPGEIGSGLAVFHPRGGIVRKVMEDYARLRHEEGGYEFVYSPHITKADLFETSGHLDWFAESMYPPMELDDGQKYYLKPMNCPFHILVYRSKQRSYRDLPMRLFEFGSVYRYEKSGVVHGLTRVRGMTQDDAHIFVTREEMSTELTSILHFVLDLLRDYGLDDFYLELSTKPEGKAVGSDEDWESATETLRRVALSMGLDLVLDVGGGAFYGPKISVQARDALRRTWQISTVQLDFQSPQRFSLEYVGADNARHTPVMIHRALFGSVERFFAVLLEHYAGAFPTWLAPVQVRVLPVRDDHSDYASSVLGSLRQLSLRADWEAATEPLGARVRRAKLEKVPYVLVVGDEDVANATVGVNQRGSERAERGVPVAQFLERVQADAAGPLGRRRPARESG